MAVINRLDNGKPLTMVAVRIGSQLMLYLMRLEIGETPHFQNPILRHRRIPHQIAPRLHILGIADETAHIYHGVSHNRQRHIIRNIVLI